MQSAARGQQQFVQPAVSEDRSRRERNTRQRRSDDTTFFLPGATIPESGIYEVLHENAHRAIHESVLVKGNAFPFCDICNGPRTLPCRAHGAVHLRR